MVFFSDIEKSDHGGISFFSRMLKHFDAIIQRLLLLLLLPQMMMNQGKMQTQTLTLIEPILIVRRQLKWLNNYDFKQKSIRINTYTFSKFCKHYYIAGDFFQVSHDAIQMKAFCYIFCRCPIQLSPRNLSTNSLMKQQMDFQVVIIGASVVSAWVLISRGSSTTPTFRL